MVLRRLGTVASVALFVAGLVHPAFGQKIYWAETFFEQPCPPSCGYHYKILRADPDGTNVEDVVTSPHPPDALFVDPPRGRIYWTVSGGAIYRANLDGSGVQRLLIEQEPFGIAVDCFERRLYWSFGSGIGPVGIRRADLDAAAIQTIYQNTSNHGPERVAVDTAGKKLYWTDYHDIARANLNGTQIEVVATVAEPLQAWGIAVDTIRGKVYWTAIGAFSKEITPGKVQRANLDGTQIQDLTSLAPGAYSEIAVDPHARKIYWTDAFMIRRADLDGSNGEAIIALSREGGGPIAIDARQCIPTLAPWGVVALLVGLIAAGLVIMRRRQLNASARCRLMRSAGIECGLLLANGLPCGPLVRGLQRGTIGV